jgi:hypothetical protein
MKIQITREAVRTMATTLLQQCKDGYHKDESGECEKVVNNKGKPRCPNGYHRRPDGNCESARD